MEKGLLKRMAVIFMFCLIITGGCARTWKSGRGLLSKGASETITEEELEALGIRPESSSRGMRFAETGELRDVCFDYDRSDIRPAVRRILSANAEWMKKNPKVKIQIEGHCDERGTIDYNLALGQRRASSVRRYLVILGVSANRVFTISYGEEQPVDSGHNERAWAKNRRAHFKIKAR